jgi:hypothetical protein
MMPAPRRRSARERIMIVSLERAHEGEGEGHADDDEGHGDDELVVRSHVTS